MLYVLMKMNVVFTHQNHLTEAILMNTPNISVFYHSADYISFPLRSLDPLWYV